jgi:hypothetical protein
MLMLRLLAPLALGTARFAGSRLLPLHQQSRPLCAARATPARTLDEADPKDVDDLDDDDTDFKSLDPVKLKNWAFSSLLEMEESGELELRPFYQRGFKWTQKQSSMWIESMLRGYPCLPEITLLETAEGYAVFDGQQRLTSVKLFLKGERGDMWKANAQQRRMGADKTFALEGLTLLKDLEGKTFKDLATEQQRFLRRQYDIRCAIIPDTWTMADYIDFFKRIQGGGTPMSDQELRRAITRGPFTDMLDNLSSPHNQTITSKLLNKALHASKLDTDEKQELLLRYFRLQSAPLREFGKPSMSQQGLQLMKTLNGQANTAAGTDHLNRWVTDLAMALELTLMVFPNDDERFRRAASIKPDAPSPRRVWISSDKVNKAVWDCMMYSFSNPENKQQVIDNAAAVRGAIVTLMQTNPEFQSMSVKGTEGRILAFEAAIRDVLPGSATIAKPVDVQTRRELIGRARESKSPCPLCRQPLPTLDDLVHIDHVVPRVRGGSSSLDNLQVVCKLCNLRKGARIS